MIVFNKQCIFVDVYYLRDTIEIWQIQLLWLIPNILTTSICLHVTLLAFLRLVALEVPAKYEEIDQKRRRVAIIIIWVASVTVCAITVISAHFSDTVALISEFFTLHGCHTLPICLIVIMYLRILWTISQKKIRGISNVDPTELPKAAKFATERINSKKNEMFRMITGNVLRLIICYVPYIVSWHIHVEIDFRGTYEHTTGVRIQTI